MDQQLLVLQVVQVDQQLLVLQVVREELQQLVLQVDQKHQVLPVVQVDQHLVVQVGQQQQQDPLLDLQVSYVSRALSLPSAEHFEAGLQGEELEAVLWRVGTYLGKEARGDLLRRIAGWVVEENTTAAEQRRLRRVLKLKNKVTDSKLENLFLCMKYF